MPVYVDHAQLEFRRMLMSHMMADTTEELLDMVDRIGVQRKWIQRAGTPDEHFDISEGKRTLAVRNGAIEVDGWDLVNLRRHKRGEPPVLKPCGA